MDDKTQDPTAMVVVENSASESVAIQPTGLKTDGETNGVIDLQIPNLLPTDNSVEARDVQVRRTKIPVRITHVSIQVIDNGYIVNLPQAGRQSDYGPDGTKHAFGDKAAMLGFIGQVVGQVTYQYREEQIHEAEPDDEEDSVEVKMRGFASTMLVQ